MQLSSIDWIDPSVHGIHLEPCYKKFTKIISVARKRNADEAESTRIKRKKLEECLNTVGLFPKTCVFCNQQRKSVNKTVYTLHKITTNDAVELVKKAAEIKNDEQLLLRIRGIVLIAKEMQMHRICYIDFTRIITLKSKPSEADETEFKCGGFESVKSFISGSILTLNQAVSITVLRQIYGTGFGNENEKVCRNKLKKRIIDEYGKSVMFLKVDGKTPEVVVSSEGLHSTTIVKDKTGIIKQAAEYLQEEILEYASKTDMLDWPPRLEQLKNSETNFPTNLTEFLTNLLKSDCGNSDVIERLVHSYGSDLIQGVTSGKVVTLKHFLIGLGLHNVTGLKTPIKILSHLGHSIDYNLVCEVETAEAAQKWMSESQSLQQIKNQSLHTGGLITSTRMLIHTLGKEL